MKRIYLDNAATTAIDPEVVEVMLPYLTEKFGNPSSLHAYGREAKTAVEAARKTILKHLNAKPNEIIFTSCATESTNTAIQVALRDLACTHIITSPIEHHATLHSVTYYAEQYHAQVEFVQVKPNGHIDLEHLQTLLAKAPAGKTLLTLMHANNEIGNLLDVDKVGEICEQYQVYFHCDMVQTIAHYPLDFSKLKVHFASCSAHKFHGPKGVGFLFVRNGLKIHSFLQGGGQERSMRAGTENVMGIVGLAKALDLAMNRYEADSQYIQGLKSYFLKALKSQFPAIKVNGDEGVQSLYTILNISFPKTQNSEMLLFNLDVAGICVSAGSACSSGAMAGSHVLGHLNPDDEAVAIRFSFCRNNTLAELDFTLQQLKSLL